MNLYLIIAGIAVCIALSAFCSSSEMAYSSCNTIRLEGMKDDGSKRASPVSYTHLTLPTKA